MHGPAFATPASLPTRASRLRPSLCPRMSYPSAPPVPQPALTPLQKTGLFARLQCVEGYLVPNFVSPFAVQSSLPDATPFSILRAVFGNAHLMESELSDLAPIINRYNLTEDVREFLRALAKSSAFTSRFVESSSPWRTVEVLYKVLLARSPAYYEEVVATLAVMQGSGYPATVDCLVDSQEYTTLFGSGLVPYMCVDGMYTSYGAMPAFNTQMRLQLPSRGGSSDATVNAGRTVSTLAGGNSAGIVEIATAYEMSVPKYETNEWMKLPTSTLATDWAAATLNGTDAAAGWSGLGTPRETGEAKEEWSDGWKPVAVGEQWKPGWYGKTPKSYV